MDAISIGNHVERERVALARERLTAYCQRHNISLRYLDRDADAHTILTEIYLQARDGELFPMSRYYGALQVFRRAIGSRRATGLHYDSGTRRAYESW